MSTPSPHIVSTTDATFQQDVIERSHQVPVVVDFWATWCQPCLILAPLLEKLAAEYAGRFVLVKAETEQNPSAAAQFQVSSIPAVFAVAGGELVDFFAGVVPEGHLRSWLDRLILDFEIRSTAALESSDPAAAEAKYRELAEKLPRDANVQIGLARVLVNRNRLEDAQAIIESLESRGFLEPEAQTVKAALDLAGMKGADIGELERQAAAAPQDLGIQLQLAEALAGAGRHEAALSRCLEIIGQDRTGPGEQARQLMLDIFRVLPGDSELVGVYRRKLASVLY